MGARTAAVVMMIGFHSSAMAADVRDDATVQSALLACQFASSGLGIVAEKFGHDPKVVDTAEGRRLFISTIDGFISEWVVMTPELKAVLLTSFGKGLRRQQEDPMQHAEGLTKAQKEKYLEMSWHSASAVAERECAFRMGELHGQGRLGSVVKAP